MKYLIFFLPFIVNCSHITYIGKPDGSTEINGWSIGTQRTLSGVAMAIEGNKRTLNIDKLDTNQAEAIKQINTGLSLLIEGAVKGAK